MSNFKGHKNSGYLIAILVVIVFIFQSVTKSITVSYIQNAACGLSTFLFALFPDVDTKSTPSKYFYGGLIIVLVAMFYYKMHIAAHAIAIISLVPQITKHRGLFHNKLTALIIPAYSFLLVYFNYIDIQFAVALYVSGVIGYYTHLLLDYV